MRLSIWPDRFVSAAALAVCLAAAGCGKPSETALLAKVDKHLAADKLADATIELKAHLAKVPDSLGARVRLAEVLLTGGDAVGAEVELRRALELGASQQAVLPPLARALFQQRKLAELMQLAADPMPSDAAANADFSLTLARALQSRGELEAARTKVEAALAATPEQPALLAMRVRLQAAGDERQPALAQAQTLAARFGQSADVALLLADALSDAGDPGAQAAFERALALDRRLEPAHGALVMGALRAGQPERARDRLRAMAAALPKSANLPYLEAVIAYQSGDFLRARELTQRLVRAGGNSPQIWTLAGAAERRLGALEQAEHLLGKALVARPDQVALRRELAEIELDRGRPAAALARLKPVLDANPRDAAAWSLVAHARTLLGDFAAADAAFARARAAKPDDTRTQLAYARSQLARGDGSAGITELRTLADRPEAQDSRGPGARQALQELVPALARRGDVAGALAAVERLARAQPKSPEPELLRGGLHEQRGDAAAARAAYEAALKRQAGYGLAIERLAALDLAQGQPAAARARYEAQLERDPRSAAAMLALADIERAAGGEPAAMRRWLDQAVQARPDDDRVWLSAIEFERGTGPAWLSRAQRAAAALPEQPEILVALAQAQRAGGEPRQAAATLRKAALLRPDSARLKVLLADALAGGGQLAAARTALDQALAQDAQDLDVVRAHVLLLWREGRADAAVARAEQERKRHPADIERVLLLADVHGHTGQPQRAIAVLREAATGLRNTRLASRLIAELRRHASAREATAFEEQWLARSPGDVDFLAAAAQQATLAGERAAAVGLYRRALALQPRAPLLKNNLAALLLQDGQAQEALALAEAAAKAAPGSAPVLDTLALAQAASGKPKDALSTQERALRIEPDSPTLRLTLARLLLQTGDKRQAREQLESLARRDTEAPFQAEVKALLAKLP